MIEALLAALPTEDHLAGCCHALLGEPTSLAPADDVLALARAEIAAERDPLGDVFCELRSRRVRREQGQFYTPAPIVAAMCAWVLDTAAVRAVDAGAGSGRYAIALRRAGFAGTVIAVDLDPLSVLMTRAHAHVAGVDIDVREESFLTLDLPDVAGPTAWFGNPPYLRHHALDAETKAWAKAAGRRLDVSVSGLAGLHALFFLAVADLGSPGDVGTFITSSEWFDNNYGSLVRTLLTGPLGLQRLDIVPPTENTFDDATTTAVITSFELGTRTEPEVVSVTDPGQLTELNGGTRLARTALAESSGWTATLAGQLDDVPTGFVRLAEYLKVTRGVATGANHFFTATPDHAAALGLAAYTRPLIARATDVYTAAGTIDPDALAKVLLVLPDRTDDEAVDTYVTAAEQRNVHTGYITSSRTSWYRVESPAAPEVVATYMARQPPRFAVNLSRGSSGRGPAVNLNNVHGLRPQPGFPLELLPVLVAWLNDNGATLVGGRTYAGGLNKFEPREMGNLLVPDIEALRALS